MKQKKSILFLAISSLFFLNFLSAIDFGKITALNFSGVAVGNIPITSGDIEFTSSSPWAIMNPSFEGVTLIGDDREAQFTTGFSGNFAVEFDYTITFSLGLEFEETQVNYLGNGVLGDPYLIGATYYSLNSFPRDIVHRSLSLPIRATYIVDLFLFKINFSLGPNIVYYFEGTETHKGTDFVGFDDIQYIGVFEDVADVLIPNITAFGLPLDISLGGELHFTVPFSDAGEFLLGVGYTHNFSSPKYTLDPDRDLTDRAMPAATDVRKYDLTFNPLKIALGFKYFIFKKPKQTREPGLDLSGHVIESKTELPSGNTAIDFNW